MPFTRNLKYLMQGADVRYMKDALVRLGYLHASTHDRFGKDTREAVRQYQRMHLDTDGRPLTVDGIIGRKTWGAIERDLAAIDGTPADTEAIPKNIGEVAAKAIAASLAAVSDARRSLVLHALTFAYDPTVEAPYPYSLYIRGGNLYNTDLSLNTITEKRIEDGAKRQPEYYSGGSKQMMLAAVEADPSTTGADCSGGVVGLMRHFRFVAPRFDATANSLLGNSHSTAVQKSALRAGDWVGRDGHIGIYVGGGYVIEWMGKLFGCQLTQLDHRRGYDFVGKKLRSKSGWTKFRRPKYY